MRLCEWCHVLRLLIMDSISTECNWEEISHGLQSTGTPARASEQGKEGGSEYLVSKGFILHLIRELGLTFTMGVGGSLQFPCLHSEVSETFQGHWRLSRDAVLPGKAREQRWQGLGLRLATHQSARTPTLRDGTNGPHSASPSAPPTAHLQNGDARRYFTRPAGVNQLKHDCAQLLLR